MVSWKLENRAIGNDIIDDHSCALLCQDVWDEPYRKITYVAAILAPPGLGIDIMITRRQPLHSISKSLVVPTWIFRRSTSDSDQSLVTAYRPVVV